MWTLVILESGIVHELLHPKVSYHGKLLGPLMSLPGTIVESGQKGKLLTKSH